MSIIIQNTVKIEAYFKQHKITKRNNLLKNYKPKTLTKKKDTSKCKEIFKDQLSYINKIDDFIGNNL